MTILAFWSVDNDSVDRHTLDYVSDVDAFDILWHRRDELDAKFYDMTKRSIGDFYLMGTCFDFEEDYNDEMLDGGHWCKVLSVDDEDVKQIIED